MPALHATPWIITPWHPCYATAADIQIRLAQHEHRHPPMDPCLPGLPTIQSAPTRQLSRLDMAALSLPSSIDLTTLAKAQRDEDIATAVKDTSLVLQPVAIPATDFTLLCDMATGVPRLENLPPWLVLCPQFMVTPISSHVLIVLCVGQKQFH